MCFFYELFSLVQVLVQIWLLKIGPKMNNKVAFNTRHHIIWPVPAKAEVETGYTTTKTKLNRTNKMTNI